MRQNATVDSSFWINAHRSGLLPYVLVRYEVRYPTAVGLEMKESFPSGRRFWELARAGTLVEVCSGSARVEGFGSGERAALEVAVEHPDWVLLMDDYRPFQEALRLGLRVICTPALVVALFGDRTLTAHQALVMLAQLAALQTLSPHLLSAALAQLGRSFRQRGDST